MSERNKIRTSILLGDVRDGSEPAPVPDVVLIYIPSLAEDEWFQLDIPVKTGYATSGTAVRCLVPDDLPAEFLVGDARVFAPNVIRIRICNNGLFRSAPREVLIRLLPVETKRPSAFPELKFDLPRIKL